MTAVQVSTRHLTLVHAGRRTDVSVPEGLYLGEVADAVGAGPGLYLGRLALLDGTGRVLDPRARVADSVESGDGLWLVEATDLLPSGHPRDVVDPGPEDGAQVERFQLGLVWIAAALALGAAYVIRVLLPRPTAVGWHTLAVSLVLAATAAGLALRPGNERVDRWCRWVAPVFGLAAGLSYPFTVQEGSLQLAVAAGLLVAAGSAALARIRAPEDDGVATAQLAALAAGALVCVLGVLLEWPGHVAWALLAGASPLVLRALPSMSLDVPDDQLIDTERFATTVWTARLGPARRRGGRLRRAAVAARVTRAQRLMTTGALALALASTVGLAALLSSSEGAGSLARWASTAEGLMLVAALGLQTRTLRARTPKLILQVASAVLLVEVVVALATRLTWSASVLLLCAVLALAVVGLASGVALSHGWHSVRLSRFADLLEGLAVAFVLPCALVGVDALEALRRITSG